MLHAYLAALALAMVALAMSGCGGSSSKTAATSTASAGTTPTATAPASTIPTTTAPNKLVAVKLASGKPLSRAQWLAKGDAICARLNAELATTNVKSMQEFARVLPQAAAQERTELAQLVKLVPPSSMADDWQEFLTSTKEWAEASSTLAQSAQTKTISLADPLVASTKKLHEHLAHLAARDGFKECSLV